MTFANGDTTFVEKLRIIAEDDGLFYEADVQENPQPVRFKFTSISTHGFVCENPTHDFPKMITYQYDEDLLTVTISGDGRTMSFRFRKE